MFFTTLHYTTLCCSILTTLNAMLCSAAAVVTESQARPTSRARPCPLNTIELQKRASRFLRMSSDTTMLVAEALYQRGILSYPRWLDTHTAHTHAQLTYIYTPRQTVLTRLHCAELC